MLSLISLALRSTKAGWASPWDQAAVLLRLVLRLCKIHFLQITVDAEVVIFFQSLVEDVDWRAGVTFNVVTHLLSHYAQRKQVEHHLGTKLQSQRILTQFMYPCNSWTFNPRTISQSFTTSLRRELVIFFKLVLRNSIPESVPTSTSGLPIFAIIIHSLSL